ncbi:MAG: hypothetical protein AB1696_11350 [Planctomycetota bacterium]
MDSDRITEEVLAIQRYIGQKWGRHFTTQLEQRLCQIFPRPENPGLQHIWRYGSADLVVYRGTRPICIIETGGAHHFDEKQIKNDRRKWKLAEINGVKCLTMVNRVMESLSSRKWRSLLGRYLFGEFP